MYYLVSYDLRKDGRDYESLYDQLKFYDGERILRSQWVIKSSLDINMVLETFQSCMDNNDGLLVIDITAALESGRSNSKWIRPFGVVPNSYIGE